MYKQSKIKILLVILSGLFLALSLTGCFGSSSDEVLISQIGKNIEEAIKEKDVDLFMENISDDYSDSNGGTYDNHINGLPEEIFLNIEENEELVDNLFIFKIEPEAEIPEDDIIVTDIYASGKMEITITLKMCIAICVDIYFEKTEYNVDFKKEDEKWKIISLEEI
jgi:hypothetical protein